MPYWYREYVPVSARRAEAKKKMEKLRKQGKDIQPVEIEGLKIAHSFWGKGWCKHLESFSDFSNRLPRGRTYARNGSVCHLEIQPGRVEALVSGSSLYTVTVEIKALPSSAWKAIKAKCAGGIGSMLELLQGKLSNEVMTVVSDRDGGLFPKPREITLKCSCPDWATMCKHVAAVLYGVGNRLDSRPELLFLLRDVAAEELISAELALPGGDGARSSDALAADQLGGIFGIEIDEGDSAPAPAPAPAKGAGKRGQSRKAAKPPRAKEPEKAVGKKPAGRATPARAAMAARNPQADTPPAPRLRPSSASVARLRKKLGLSVAEFAAALGVSAATVNRWESDGGPLTLRRRPLQALAKLHEEAKSGAS
ncbi:MAG: helix-turn-helix domain-containing protein [Candidatus Hydrogenedentes bacterium]|nr:helix-turn-helix domain-containing protein [Candidatus Hydrogenedentota bacterium]